MDALFVPLASAVGASVDQIKLISCLLFSYPLGSLFIRMPSSQPAFKHLFSISVTIFYLLGVFSLWNGFFQLLGSILATYFIAANVRGPSMPWIVFGVVMGHLTVNHVIRALFELSYETFEVTGPQMVLTMKLTTFAWNVYDGRRPATELDKWQTAMRVTKYPSLLEFLGYSFYFPGFLVGPYLEYATYMDLVNETLFTTHNGEVAQKSSGRRVPKGRKRVAYRKMAMGLTYLGLFVLLNPKFNYSMVLEDSFAKKSFMYRIIYFQIGGFFERTKYYAIWTLTEGASILTGLGFTGFSPSGASLWEGAANVNIRLIEFAPNFKVLLDSWNMKTNVWLRECMYKRVTPAGKKPGFRSSMLTFATSAFWHGIAGGYYLTFLFGGFVQTAGRLCRSNLRPLLLPPKGSKSVPPAVPATWMKRAYDVAGTASSIAILNYTAAPFMLLGLQKSLHAWAILGWYGHWMIVTTLAFCYLGGTRYLKNLQKARVAKAERADHTIHPSASQSSLGNGYDDGTLQMPPVDQAMEGMEREVEKELKKRNI
ncbi:MBOAT-domain-containing protein [Rickenella mellea]|uniref:MBOAT-domain-containing protein n=1 Tax=Rickenella mellea TaxID=50990 RepID=A0A4R5XFP1_9AGAM|nr:MBOAT-domain-containing protein [Rickenella mellea]